MLSSFHPNWTQSTASRRVFGEFVVKGGMSIVKYDEYKGSACLLERSTHEIERGLPSLFGTGLSFDRYPRLLCKACLWISDVPSLETDRRFSISECVLLWNPTLQREE